MIFVKALIGLFFFVLGLIYFYKPEVIVKLNRIAREIIFNDRIILLERKKLAILFFCLAFIALYMGFSSLTNIFNYEQEKKLSKLHVDSIMYIAMQDYCNGKFENALKKYKTVLKSHPDNIDALKRIAYTYHAMEDQKKAGETWKRLSRIYPNDKEIKQNLEFFQNENIREN